MRRRVSIKELAEYFGVSRPTLHKRLREYKRVKKNKYNPENIKSVFDFFAYLQKQ
jgi:hypothetical protein